MISFGTTIRRLFEVAGALVALLMLLCAYSPLLDPEQHPVLACAGMAFPIFAFLNGVFLLLWLLLRWRSAWVALLSFALCYGALRDCLPLHFSRPEPPEGSIRLLSFNTMAFGDGQPHRKGKPNTALDYLATSGADILCLQEYIAGRDKYHLQHRDVERALRDYPYRRYLQVGTNDNGLGIYSRFPILSQRKLPYESLYNGSAMYELDVCGDTLVIINNHLESNKLTLEDKRLYRQMLHSPEKENVEQGARLLIGRLSEAMAIRARQTRLIGHLVDSLLERGRRVVVCGDCNDTPVSFTHRRLTRRLHSAFVQAGNGLGVSYNQNGFYFRIDHILLSPGMRAFDCRVDRSIRVSDHYPIVCSIAWEGLCNHPSKSKP